jgi:hypothetical protein
MFVLLGALSVAIYTGNSWELFYVLLGIGVVRILGKFIAHRLKWARLVYSQTSRADNSPQHHTHSFGDIFGGSGKIWVAVQLRWTFLCSELAGITVRMEYFCAYTLSSILMVVLICTLYVGPCVWFMVNPCLSLGA